MVFDPVIAPLGKDIFLSDYWELPVTPGRQIGHLSDKFWTSP
jgi:hypothetical protein